jgi:hypothetical protein
MTMNDYRKMAAAMDLRVRQLAAEGVPGPAVIERMVGHLPDLQRIWTSAPDEQLAMLCREYPGFYRYATLVEEAAEAERQKTTTSYQDLPELPDSLKQQLSSLLVNAAKLERGYQSVLDAGDRPGSRQRIIEMVALHRKWGADLTRFRVALQSSDIPQTSRDIVTPALERMSQRIAQLEARAQAR